MANGQFTQEQLEAFKQRLAQLQSQDDQGMQNMPAPLSQLDPANRQVQNPVGNPSMLDPANRQVQELGNDLPPQNKIEALKRLQKQNFLDQGESAQIPPPPQPTPFTEELKNRLTGKQRQDLMDQLFPRL